MFSLCSKIKLNLVRKLYRLRFYFAYILEKNEFAEVLCIFKNLRYRFENNFINGL